MIIIGWVVWGVALVILIVQVALFYHRDPGVARLAKRFAFLIIIGLAITVFINLSKLHLLWWLPVCYIFNMLFFGAALRVAANRAIGKQLEQGQQGQIAQKQHGNNAMRKDSE